MVKTTTQMCGRNTFTNLIREAEGYGLERAGDHSLNDLKNYCNDHRPRRPQQKALDRFGFTRSTHPEAAALGPAPVDDADDELYVDDDQEHMATSAAAALPAPAIQGDTGGKPYVEGAEASQIARLPPSPSAAPSRPASHMPSKRAASAVPLASDTESDAEHVPHTKPLSHKARGKRRMPEVISLISSDVDMPDTAPSRFQRIIPDSDKEIDGFDSDIDDDMAAAISASLQTLGTRPADMATSSTSFSTTSSISVTLSTPSTATSCYATAATPSSSFATAASSSATPLTPFSTGASHAATVAARTWPPSSFHAASDYSDTTAATATPEAQTMQPTRLLPGSDNRRLLRSFVGLAVELPMEKRSLYDKAQSLPPGLLDLRDVLAFGLYDRGLRGVKLNTDLEKVYPPISLGPNPPSASTRGAACDRWLQARIRMLDETVVFFEDFWATGFVKPSDKYDPDIPLDTPTPGSHSGPAADSQSATADASQPGGAARIQYQTYSIRYDKVVTASDWWEAPAGFAKELNATDPADHAYTCSKKHRACTQAKLDAFYDRNWRATWADRSFFALRLVDAGLQPWSIEQGLVQANPHIDHDHILAGCIPRFWDDDGKSRTTTNTQRLSTYFYCNQHDRIEICNMSTTKILKLACGLLNHAQWLDAILHCTSAADVHSCMVLQASHLCGNGPWCLGLFDIVYEDTGLNALRRPCHEAGHCTCYAATVSGVPCIVDRARTVVNHYIRRFNDVKMQNFPLLGDCPLTGCDYTIPDWADLSKMPNSTATVAAYIRKHLTEMHGYNRRGPYHLH